MEGGGCFTSAQSNPVGQLFAPSCAFSPSLNQVCSILFHMLVNNIDLNLPCKFKELVKLLINEAWSMMKDVFLAGEGEGGMLGVRAKLRGHQNISLVVFDFSVSVMLNKMCFPVSTKTHCRMLSEPFYFYFPFKFESIKVTSTVSTVLFDSRKYATFCL